MLNDLELNFKEKKSEKEARRFFLQNLKICSDKNNDFVNRAKISIQECLDILKQLSEKFEELTYLFSCIAVSYREMEDTAYGDILKIEPKLSSVYKNIEKVFPRWKKYSSNLTSHLKKLVLPSLDYLHSNICENRKVLNLF